MAKATVKSQANLQAAHTLDELSAKTVKELDELFRGGTVPATFKVLDGTPKGRMLVVRNTRYTPLSPIIRWFSASDFFPWDGKSFESISDTRGKGINRVYIFGKHNLFPFEIRVQPSVIDGKPCIYLDYEQPENAWAIRMIHDEIREISPKMFLGPAMWKDNKGGATFVLWFALETK